MAEQKVRRGRARRSTEVSRRLEQARRRNTAQLAEQREWEKRVEGALEVYVSAEERIVESRGECLTRVAALEDEIARLRATADEEELRERAAQARAALTIHEAKRTVEQVAELLDVSVKEARRLIAAGRDGVPPGPVSRGARQPGDTATLTREPTDLPALTGCGEGHASTAPA